MPASDERVLLRLRDGASDGLRRGELWFELEGPKAHHPVVDLADDVPEVSQVCLRGVRRFARCAFQCAKACIETFVNGNRERCSTQQSVLIPHLDRKRVRAVRHGGDVQIDLEWRLSKIAADAVKCAQLNWGRSGGRLLTTVLHNAGPGGSTRRRQRHAVQAEGWRNAHPKGRVRTKRSRELDGRRKDLFEPYAVRHRRIDDEPICSNREGGLELADVGPGRAAEQRHPFRQQPPHFAAAPEPHGFGDLAIDLIDLHFELALWLDRRLARVVLNAQGREVG